KSDYTPMPLFYPSYGTGTTAYIANCQYSELGNTNVTVNYLASNSINALGDSIIGGDLDVGGDLSVGGDLTSAYYNAPYWYYFKKTNSGYLYWGKSITTTPAYDTNLYRYNDNILKTDDAFDAASLKIGGTEVINSSGNGVLNATPASAGVSGEVVTLTAGENLVFGEVCYAKSDGKYWKANGASADTMPAVVMAAGTISASSAGSFLLRGYARNDSWSALTIGGQVWVSAGSAGAFTQTQPAGSGNLVQNIGYATAAKTIYFDPERTIITLP
ncbi:MAG TPA: hypothetical protein PLE18_14050, partial [Candidatus Sumerlaeota bacterium]|nr:hypothetical protein [Candidatus Sumerlaeota bacterium]